MMQSEDTRCYDTNLEDLQSAGETIMYRERGPGRGQSRRKESHMQDASPRGLQSAPSSPSKSASIHPEDLSRSADRRFFANWPEYTKSRDASHASYSGTKSRLSPHRPPLSLHQELLRREKEQREEEEILRNHYDAQRRARVAQLSQSRRQQSLSSAQGRSTPANATLPSLPLESRSGRDHHSVPDSVQPHNSLVTHSAVQSPRPAEDQPVMLPEEIFDARSPHAPPIPVAQSTSPLVMSPRTDAAQGAHVQAHVVVKQPIWKKCCGEVLVDNATGTRRRRQGFKMCTCLDVADLLLALVGIAATMTLLSILHYWIFENRNGSHATNAEFVMLVSSFGGAVTMVFFDPMSPMSQPWSILIGHALGGVFGVAGRDMDALRVKNGGDEDGVFTVPLIVVMLTSISMYLLQCWHPPAVSYGLVVYLSNTGVLHALRYYAILIPGLSGAGIIVVCALLFNNALPFSWRHYPVYWI